MLTFSTTNATNFLLLIRASPILQAHPVVPSWAVITPNPLLVITVPLVANFTSYFIGGKIFSFECKQTKLPRQTDQSELTWFYLTNKLVEI